MGKRERFKKQLNETINKDNILCEYKGSKMNLVFYGVEDNVEDRKLMIHEAIPYILNDTVHIAVLNELFESSMRDNDELFVEIEERMWQSTRPIRFFYVPLLLTVYIWLTWFIAFMVFPELLYGLPYAMQVLGIVILALFIYGPLVMRIISTTYKEKYINKKLFGFHKKIRNKDFRLKYKKYKKYKNKGKKTLRNIEIYFPAPKLLSKMWVRLILVYSLPIIFVLTVFTLLGSSLNVQLGDFGGIFQAYIVENPEIPTMIKSKYSFVEKIDRESSEILFQCGEYSCDSRSGVFTTVYDGDSEIDISPYCDDNVDCVTSINQNLLYIKQYEDIDENDIDKNLFVDLNSNTIIYDIKATDFGFDSSYSMTVYDYVYDEENSDLYILARVASDNNQESILLKIEDNSNYNYVDLNGEYSMDLVMFDDALYFTSYVDQNLFSLDVYTLDLSLVTEFQLDSQYLPDIFVIKNQVHYLSQTIFYKNVYTLDDELKSKKVYTQPELLYTYLVVNDGFINNSAYFKAYREFDDQFNVVSKGLFCSECDTDDYFMNRTYIKEGSTLYAYGEENIIVFEETDDYQRSLSPGILVPGASYIILGIVLVFNVFSVLKVKNNKLEIEVLKSYLRDK